MSLTKINNNVFKSSCDSNIYYIKDINTIVDCGNRNDIDEYKKDLESIKNFNFDNIKNVILTHLHYDHIGCFDLFPNAKFYANKEAVLCINSKDKNNKIKYILNEEIAKMFDVKLYDIEDFKLNSNYEIISTPGHCKTSICIYDKKANILFSGDTLFAKGIIGRCDLPKSAPNEMHKSLQKLNEYNIKILCPGHDY